MKGDKVGRFLSLFCGIKLKSVERGREGEIRLPSVFPAVPFERRVERVFDAISCLLPAPPPPFLLLPFPASLPSPLLELWGPLHSYYKS